MLSSVLNSDRAIQANIRIMRAFIRLRDFLASHRALAARIDELEKKYDGQFDGIFGALRQILNPPDEPDPPRPRIGFHGAEDPSAAGSAGRKTRTTARSRQQIA